MKVNGREVIDQVDLKQGVYVCAGILYVVENSVLE